MIQVIEIERDEPAYWYSSKPKYPLHVNVITRAECCGCITGMKQYFDDENLKWRYQLTSMTADGPVNSWWAEEDIDRVTDDYFRVQEREEDKVVYSRTVGTLESACKFVKEYGERALQRYHETGSRREIYLQFWDTSDEDPDESLG